MSDALRFATELDIPALIPLINAAYQVEKFFKVGERTDEREMRELLEKGRFLVLEDGLTPIGCVYVEQRGERGYFGMLAVSPAYQKRGIGTCLIAGAEEFFRERGCRAVELSVVDRRTELPPLYERFGYRVTGTAPFPSDIMPVKMPCTFVVMSKPLPQSL